jgi:DNA uptake protein ComE-like DNA-binding protein
MSIRLVQPHLAKIKQMSIFGVLLTVLVLTGCSSKPKSSATTSSPAGKSSETAPAASTSKVDVSSASIAELDKLELPGTKPSLSERIQGGRPYKSAEDLVGKKVISADEYKLIKNLIVVGKAK